MSYGWRAIDEQYIELCDECGFDARDVVEETTELDATFAALAALVRDQTSADRRPEAETWSAGEYVEHCVEATRALLGYVSRVTGLEAPTVDDLTSARAACAVIVPQLDQGRRAAVLSDEYRFDVTVEWIVRHLLHDLTHHVLDIRRGYAALAMAEYPEIHTVVR